MCAKRSIFSKSVKRKIIRKTLKVSVLYTISPIEYRWGDPYLQESNLPHLFPKIFYFFYFFSPIIGYIFYLNFYHFSPIFNVFSAYFYGIFGLILCCWGIGFSVLFLYGCLRENGKFRQKAILFLVYDAPKNCIYIWLL